MLNIFTRSRRSKATASGREAGKAATNWAALALKHREDAKPDNHPMTKSSLFVLYKRSSSKISMQNEVRIVAGRTEQAYWKDIWNYRNLLFFLSWRDILVRYKQTTIGILWAILRPFFTMLAFTIVFGALAKLPSQGDAPYALMVFAATLPWQLFSTALADSSNSLINNSNLVSKVYFPRILVPISCVTVNIADFVISFAILGGLILWYDYAVSIQMLATIPLVLLTAVLALGPGLLFCALNVSYRDFRYLIPFVTQFGLYVSPVGFSSSIVPEKWLWLYELNPMVGVIEGFRWAILGTSTFPLRPLIFSCLLAAGLLLIGIVYFRKTERRFADII